MGREGHVCLSCLACGHEEGEDEDEGALGHWQVVSLLQGEEDGSVQTGFGRAADTKDTQFIFTSSLLTLQ